MKKLLVFCVAIMVGLVLLMSFSAQEMGIIGEDALSVPQNASVAQSLRSGNSDAHELIAIGSEDMLYKTLSGVVVGEKRTAINKEYPLFIRGGAALRFLNEDFWLIGTDATLLKSIEGMYLTDGYTYNQDMSQADAEEFILLQLTNGLHMNAQHTVLNTRLETIDINANSIIYFSEDVLRWYSPYGEMLYYGEAGALFDATITIGDHTWPYRDLLRALGLLNEAIEKLDDDRDPDPQQSQAEDILTGNENDQKNPGGGGSGANPDGDQTVIPDDSTGTSGDDNSQDGDSQKETQPAETKPEETEPEETEPEETKPKETEPKETEPKETEPKETEPVVTEPAETEPKETEPEETEPEETEPEETEPKETEPEETEPEETEPKETEPKETEPKETEPEETEPEETEPEETEPKETVPGEPVPDETKPEETEPEETEPEETEPEESQPVSTEPGDIAPPEGGSGETRPEETGPEETVPGDEEPGESGDPEHSESLEPEYELPQVSLGEFAPWAYAVKAKLTVEDEYGAILKGVRVTVYRGIKGAGKTDIVDGNVTAYPASSYEGTSALIRKTYNGSQEMALATLYPNTTYYIQFNYRYILEETNPETGERTVSKKTYYSDLYEVRTTDIPQEPLAKAEWTEVFAALEQQVQFNGLTLSNIADDYVAKPEVFSFENFKKTILPYINRLEFDLVDAKGNHVVLSANSTVVVNAQKAGGAVFISTRGMLTPDTEYTYTVTAKDRYNNIIPLQIDTEMGKLYTRKSPPIVTIEEVENVMDKLTLKVSVEDPYGALLQENGKAVPLSLRILHGGDGTPATLYGNWADGTSFGSLTEEMTTLLLEEPAHGKSYTFSVESLAFAMPFNVQVLGSYDPQPTDADGSQRVPKMEDVVLNSLRCYTASLSSGIIQFNTRVDDLKDSSATLNFTMGSNTTVDILPMLDAFTVEVAKKRNSEVDFTTTLTMEDLDIPFDPADYDEKTKSVVISEGGPSTPRITLIGKAEQFAGKTLWESLLVSATTDESGNKVFSNPVQLSIAIPSGTLESSTPYVFTMHSLVIKGGAAYGIDTVQNTDSFTTKKILPVIKYKDFFIASNMAQFLDFWIDDTDETILEDGLVNVMLYQVFESGDILLDVQQVRAFSPGDDEGNKYQSIRFDGIISGAQYKLQFRAASYNDADGFSSYATNVLLKEFRFEGGSGLTGKLNIQNLAYTSVISGRQLWTTEAAEYGENRKPTGEYSVPLGSGHILLRASTNPPRWRTVPLPIPEGATFLELDITVTSELRTYFQDANKKAISFGGSTVAATPAGKQPLIPIPPNAEYVYFDIQEEALPFTPWDPEDTDTLPLYFYTTPHEDLLEGLVFEEDFIHGKYTSYKIVEDSAQWLLEKKLPVNPGDVLCFSGTVGTLYLFSETGQYITAYNNVHNSHWVVPDNAAYISIQCPAHQVSSLKNLYVYKVATADHAKGLSSDILVDVQDTKEYFRNLETDGSDLSVTVRLYRSESINDPVYDELYGEKTVSDLNATFSINDLWELNALPSHCGYKMVLSTQYKYMHDGEEKVIDIILDEIYFQTDSCYFIIRNEDDFRRINNNPDGNYLVVNDFTLTKSTSAVSSLRGTLDFQGHTITMAHGSYAISSLSNSGVVRNAVVKYPAGKSIGSGFVSSNNGLMENLVFRTEGPITVTAMQRNLICNSNSGTIRNFIIRLGGDYTIKDCSGTMLMTNNSFGGVLENGYIYGVNGAGLVMTRPSDSSNYWQGMMYEPLMSSAVRNIYILLDSWHYQPTAGTKGDYSGLISGRGIHGDHIYHAGNYYRLNSEGKKDYHTLTTKRRLYAGGFGSRNAEIWHITASEYDAHSSVKAGTPDLLHDTNWQQNMLGDAFDVAHCVSMGYYPRLILPDNMARHQEYLMLPNLYAEGPTIVSDAMADPAKYPQSNEQGVIQLRFDNPGGNEIREVVIDGLFFKDIPYQGYAEDGLYDVFISVDAEACLSKYSISEFRYTTGAGLATKTCEYTTKNVEFWKSVSSVEDWCDINDHMDWNYRITTDLDFTGETGAQIDGKKTAANGTVTFTGKIDGNMYKLRNLTVNNILNRGVIYSMSSGAELRNLVVENMTLTISKGASRDSSGFVGTISSGKIDNVHFRNCRFYGVSYMGMLAGSASGTSITNCSVADSTLQSQPNGLSVRAGLLIGSADNCGIYSSYVRNSNLIVQDSLLVECVGGLVGFAKNTYITHCYTNGRIDALASYVGGIAGIADSFITIRYTWNDMDIVASGNYVGGLIALQQNYNSPSLARNLVAGDISGLGDMVHYGIGDDVLKRLSKIFANFGYDRQFISLVGDTDPMDLQMQFSAAELARKATWTDIMLLQDFWDFSPLTPDPQNPDDKPAFPMLYRHDADKMELVWGQEEIQLPGFDHTLEVTDADMDLDGQPNTFNVNVLWTHPELTGKEILDMVKGGKLNLDLDGMVLGQLAMDPAATNDNQVVLTGRDELDQEVSRIVIWPNLLNEEQTYISITTHRYDKALDVYDLRLTCDTYSASTVINYGAPLYHDVHDIDEWNSLMAQGHGTTTENFRICGPVDFNHRATGYAKLNLGRLVGCADETAKAGFYNLTYRSGGTGDPWIEKVLNDVGAETDPEQNLGGLIFQDIEADFSQVARGDSRSKTGLILFVENFINCKLTDIEMVTGPGSSRAFGFISTVNNSVKQITVEDLYVEAMSAYSWECGNIGGIAAEVKNGFTDIKATKINIRSNGSTVAALFARCGTSTTLSMKNSNAELTDITVRGENAVSFVVGSELKRSVSSVTITDSALTTNGSAYALSSWQQGTVTDVTLENVTITDQGKPSTQDQNGIAGINYRSQFATFNNVEVRNCTFTGNSSVGGIAAFGDGGTFNNCRVLDCKLISNCDKNYDNIRVGGLYGFAIGGGYREFNGCIVRNTQIQGYKYVGGLMGYGFLKANNCYVAEDVTITATGGSAAGGIAGRSSNTHLKNCAVGATVSGVDSVGGLIGLAANSDVTLDNCYVGGSVYASSNYAGALYGSVVNLDALTADKSKNLLVTASVTTPGSKASLWANSQSLGQVSPGDMAVTIWDQAVLNGQTAEAIAAHDNGTRVDSLRLPQSYRLVTADELYTENGYTAAGFSTSQWSYSGLPAFMPYPMQDATTILPYSNVNTAGQTVGIPTPEGNYNRAATVVYASGVNTVNIEKYLLPDETGTTVTVNGTPYMTDENGVVSLYYNFRDDLTVDGVTYSASSLLRSVMTYGSHWYYIQDGLVYYGEQVQDAGKPTVSGISNAIHLWQGKVLTRDGHVHQLSGGSIEKTVDPAQSLTQLDQAEPFYAYTLSNGDVSLNVNVFYNFTLYGDAVKIDYRIFPGVYHGHPVSPTQGVVYDGVLFASQDNAVSAAQEYYALLGMDGVLRNELGNWSTSKVDPEGIAHISNNFGYAEPVFLARYTDGTVTGYNYVTNELLFTTRSQTKMMMSFGFRQMGSLLGSFFNYGSNVEADYSSGNVISTEPPVSMAVPGEGTEGSLTPGTSGSNEIGGSNTDDGSVSETAPSPTGPAADMPAAPEQDGGMTNTEGTSGGSGEGEGTENDGLSVDGTADADGAGTAGSDTDTIVAGDAVVPDTGSYYVEGSGVFVDGEKVLSDEEAQYRPGEGVYRDEELIFVETLIPSTGTPDGSTSAGGGISSIASNVQIVEVVTPAVQAQQLASFMGSSLLVYNSGSGCYESVEIIELMEIQEETQPEEPEEATFPEQEESVTSKDKFVINQSENLKLTDSDQSGIMILILFALCGGAILVAIYFKSIRKKRK